MKGELRKISRKDLKHIAWLARIDLTSREEVEFTEQMNRVLEYFAKIDEADTKDVKPTYHVLEIENVVREDVERRFPSEGILKQVPQVKNRYVKAPRIT